MSSRDVARPWSFTTEAWDVAAKVDDHSVADAVVEEIRADGGNAIASYENLESEEACAGLVEGAGGVVFLAWEEWTVGGVVLSAAGGSFGVRRWARGEAVDFGQ